MWTLDLTITLTAGICVTQKLLWTTNADNFRQNSCSHSQDNKRAPEAVSALSQDAGETKPITIAAEQQSLDKEKDAMGPE